MKKLTVSLVACISVVSVNAQFGGFLNKLQNKNSR